MSPPRSFQTFEPLGLPEPAAQAVRKRASNPIGVASPPLIRTLPSKQAEMNRFGS